MFQSDELKEYLQTNHTIKTSAKVFAEWNMNQPDNIARLGNYRYRPRGTDAQYKVLPVNYDINDSGNYYTGATDADIIVDNGLNFDNTPSLFTTSRDKFKMLYSLEDCIKPFRPRSGVNKVLYLGVTGSISAAGQYLSNSGPDIATRPRYYMSSRYDQFKYWTSYRTENGSERGVSTSLVNGISYIDDAVPFVVYKESVPANRIVVKMQTNVGTTQLPDIHINANTTISDPLYGEANQTTPIKWEIQILKNGSWRTAKKFDQNSRRSDGTSIIQSDGYVEIAYGLKVPDKYKSSYLFAGVITSTDYLPTSAPFGTTYLVQENTLDRGGLYIYDQAQWVYFRPDYSWDIAESIIDINSKFIVDVTDPDYFIENNIKTYRDIEVIDGIRIVVETMNKPNCTFDLIEFSPRLAVDITNRVVDFSVMKTLSDLGNNSIPVGSLLAGTGTINIANDDGAFAEENIFNTTTSKGSIISKYLTTNIKFNFYEIIREVNGYDYYIPIKTMYSEGFPQSDGNFDNISLTLRDAFFILESNPAPSLLLTDISLSYAITVLLDYIGFTNYIFKRQDNKEDPVIPYFFIAPNQNVAEVLNQLALATQSAMFFDEYNNFVVMTKEYLIPENDEIRSKDYSLYGNTYAIDSSDNAYLLLGKISASTELTEYENGVYLNTTDGTLYKWLINQWASIGFPKRIDLPNIVQMSSSNKKISNDGQINYTKRYIQRSYGKISQAYISDEFKTWTYVPSLIWEVAPEENTKTVNEASANQSGYTLTAMPLNSDLSSVIPSVSNGQIINNIIDVGEAIYYIARYNGYFYANGEIIKYDAVEYVVTGQTGILEPVWINNADEYQKYLLKLPFNGKMYPTGRIRIFAEPEYATINGITKIVSIAKHGRGQFGTEITNHKSGIDSHWTDNANVYGCQMQSSYLFTPADYIWYPKELGKNVSAGVSPSKAKTSSRNGLIKNILSQKYWTEEEIRSMNVAQAGTIQSSALVFNGPSFSSNESPRDYVSYVNKKLDKPYRQYGTRMRIIGKIESEGSKVQTPIGVTEYITVDRSNDSQGVSISGGSGGIGVMVNPQTNAGYYFEICALTSSNVTEYKKSNVVQNAVLEINSGAQYFSSTNDVLITTKQNHGFAVGQDITIAGLSQNYMNGKFTVKEIISPTSLRYSITNKFNIYSTSSSANSATITTTLPHNFSVGSSVTISGVRQFYKVIKKQLSGNVATLIFNQNHRFSVGNSIVVYDVGSDFNGTYTITGASANAVAYSKTSASTISLQDATGTVISSDLDSAYNGTYTITSVSGKKFSYSKSNGTIAENIQQQSNIIYAQVSISNASSSSAGTATREISSNANIANVYFYKMMQGQDTYSIENNGVSSNGSIVTVTTSLPHNFTTGQTVIIKDLFLSNGVNINGSRIVVDTPTSNTFTFNFTSAAFSNLGLYGSAYTEDLEAIPYKMWSGLSNILVDSGKFYGQSRVVAEENPTVYDLSVEYKDINENKRIFYLYLNNKQIATVVDDNPLNNYNTVSLFVRGSSRCMFENVYGLSENYSQNSVFTVAENISDVFGDKEINASEALRKYAMSGFVQATYLSGISSQQPPQYNLYFEEFGTIFREAAHFDIKYDKAWPALYARLAPTINSVKTYTTSGFYAGSYGADFLIFNALDQPINLDAKTGNFLRIQGIVFTQNTTKTLTVDNYLNKMSDFSNPMLDNGNLLYNPLYYKELYNQIKVSRMRYGQNQFTIESPYIQTDDMAEEMIGWIISKTMKPKQNIGLVGFGLQLLQLGDIVSVQYVNNNGINVISDPNKKFVIYNTEYTKNLDETNMNLYLAEV